MAKVTPYQQVPPLYDYAIHVGHWGDALPNGPTSYHFIYWCDFCAGYLGEFWYYAVPSPEIAEGLVQTLLANPHWINQCCVYCRNFDYGPNFPRIARPFDHRSPRLHYNNCPYTKDYPPLVRIDYDDLAPGPPDLEFACSYKPPCPTHPEP